MTTYGLSVLDFESHDARGMAALATELKARVLVGPLWNPFMLQIRNDDMPSFQAMNPDGRRLRFDRCSAKMAVQMTLMQADLSSITEDGAAALFDQLIRLALGEEEASAQLKRRLATAHALNVDGDKLAYEMSKDSKTRELEALERETERQSMKLQGLLDKMVKGNELAQGATAK